MSARAKGRAEEIPSIPHDPDVWPPPTPQEPRCSCIHSNSYQEVMFTSLVACTNHQTDRLMGCTLHESSVSHR